MVQNLHAHLTAMSVAGEHQFNAELRRTRKGIWVVRKKNVGHIVPNQRIGMRQHDHATATEAPGELIIDSDQIQFSAAPADLRIFLAEKFHPVICEEL